MFCLNAYLFLTLTFCNRNRNRNRNRYFRSRNRSRSRNRNRYFKNRNSAKLSVLSTNRNGFISIISINNLSRVKFGES